MSVLLATDFDAAETALWLALLREHLPGETITAARADVDPSQVDVALVASPPPGALQGLPRLALVHSLWAGVDRLLADASIPPSLPIVRMVDPAMNAAMAQTALWAVLSLHRGFFAYAARQRAGTWRPHAQRRADEVHVAVLGLGQMGRTTALRLRDNGYRVSGWSTQSADVAGVDARHGDAALTALLAEADIVVNLLPLTPATRGLFDAARFAQMRPGAGFVNLARGAHVVEADLLAALAHGTPEHAVLDVFATEPLPAGHVFWAHPQVTVLPHAAAMTDPRSAAQVVADNLKRWRAGEPLAHRVDRSKGY